MRLAGLSAALIVAASLAASVAAQNAPQDQREVFLEGLTACASMFSERHPAGPPPFPPSSSPFIDNGYGKERFAAYGFKPLPIEDMLKAGWEAERNMLGQRPSIELAKRGVWGRATLRQSDLSCNFAVFANRDSQLDADLLLATAASWVATTYPGASLEGEAETLDERTNARIRSKPSAVWRTRWKSPDGMRVSLGIRREEGERGAIYVSADTSYLPARPPPPAPPSTRPI
jgi:hypothetical protein